jgi:hypothetical protein
MTDSYFIEYYKTHKYKLRMKAYIVKAHTREDTKQWYLRKAKSLLPLVKIEMKERLRIERLKQKVPKVLPKKKSPKKKCVKYKVIDDDSFILDFN